MLKDIAQKLLAEFDFPQEAKALTSEAWLRDAIYASFGKKDFHTQAPMLQSEMSIDHLIPQSLGGPDNIYNYVPTKGGINNRRGNRLDELSTRIKLATVREIYAPKIVTSRPNQQLNNVKVKIKPKHRILESLVILEIDAFKPEHIAACFDLARLADGLICYQTNEYGDKQKFSEIEKLINDAGKVHLTLKTTKGKSLLGCRAVVNSSLNYDPMTGFITSMIQFGDPLMQAAKADAISLSIPDNVRIISRPFVRPANQPNVRFSP